jgi:transcriptional regulator with XRE-family HTH domain
MTNEDVLSELKRRQGDGSQKALAERIGVSPQYLVDVIKKRREPGPKILKALGIVKTVTFNKRKPA